MERGPSSLTLAPLPFLSRQLFSPSMGVTDMNLPDLDSSLASVSLPLQRPPFPPPKEALISPCQPSPLCPPSLAHTGAFFPSEKADLWLFQPLTG